MKKLLILAMACMMVFVGCGQKSKEVNVAVKDIVEDIKARMIEDLKEAGVPEENFQDGQLPGYLETDLLSGDDMMGPIGDLFKKEDLEEGIIIQHMMNLNADLIMVLKAKDNDAVASLEETINKIHEQQDALWSKYLPDQYEKVKNTIIKNTGEYLIYITYDKPESIETIIDEALK